MKHSTGQSINIKRRVKWRRIGIWLGEVSIVILFVIVMLAMLFVAIAEVVSWLKTGSFFDLFYGWDLLREKDKSTDNILSQDVATIFVAAASILVAISTIVQAHFTRVQDRVSSLPKNYFTWISISTRVDQNIDVMKKYFDKVIGDIFIEFNIKEGFSTCYKANPYRMYVFLVEDNDKNKIELEELIINQSKCNNLNDSDANSYEMLIDCGQSSLFLKYCNLPSGNNRYNLKIFLDIEWINQLVPKWWRWFANIYIREEIFLEDKKRNDKKNFLFNNNYRILYTNHYRAPWGKNIKMAKLRFF